MPTKVIARKLRSPHQEAPFTQFLPLGAGLVRDIRDAIASMFDALGGASLLKASRDVYLKPNAVDAKPYSHTRVEVLREIILYWQRAGARRVWLFEGSTQAHATRLVFRGAGYTRLCRETGAIPIYLDEEKTHTLSFGGHPHQDYDLGSFDMPETVVRLMRERDQHLYINVPKLKTHSMGVVTLGVKNQWGFPVHRHRGFDHNHHLHGKLVDVLAHIQPDVTLIEGVEGTIHGHHFATALADRQVRPFRVLIAGTNIVAVDLVGARIFGLRPRDVPHLQLAIERGLSGGVHGDADIELTGDLTCLDGIDLLGDMPAEGHYPWDLYPAFPPDVQRIWGTQLACREGCVNNPLSVLQTLYFDYEGKGGFTLVAGKGHDPATIDALQGRVLVAGHCAIEEVGDRLIQRLGRENVYLSGECNDLRATVEALFHLMKVDPTRLVPLHPLVAASDYLLARLHGSNARVPHPLARWIKRV